MRCECAFFVTLFETRVHFCFLRKTSARAAPGRARKTRRRCAVRALRAPCRDLASAMMPRVSPLLLMESEGGRVHVGEAGADFLSNLQSESVVLITHAGVPRSGKSFLANRLHGRMDGFRVSSGSTACTRGVWLWPVAQHLDVPLGASGEVRRVAIVHLDCEALHDAESEALFCVAAAVSAALVFSSVGRIEESHLELIASLFAGGGDPAIAPSPAGGSGVGAIHASPGTWPTASRGAAVAEARPREAREARLRRAFDSIDLDGSGTVGKRELYTALRAVGVSGATSEMLALYQSVDGDGSGQLSFAEFRALARRLPQLAELCIDAGGGTYDGAELELAPQPPLPAEPVAFSPPFFVWAVRDAAAPSQQHSLPGEPSAPSTLLEAALYAGDRSNGRAQPAGRRYKAGKPVLGRSAASHASSHTGKLLRFLLPRRDCVVLPRPCAASRVGSRSPRRAPRSRGSEPSSRAASVSSQVEGLTRVRPAAARRRTPSSPPSSRG